jgi:secreted protein with Ig-like and vWFA domain
LVKETIDFIAKNMTARDRLALVAYSDTATTVLPLTYMTEAGQTACEAVVAGLQAAGCTALCKGLLQAVDLLHARGKDANEVSSVLLFTDGQANRGFCSPGDITRALQEPAFAQTEPTSAYGFGPRRVAQKQQTQQTQNFTSKSTNGVRQATNIPTIAENISLALPCTINTFGYGEGHRADLLEAIADHGNGVYYYLDGKCRSQQYAFSQQ